MKIVRFSAAGVKDVYDDGQPPPVPKCHCVCCGYLTIVRRFWYEICPVCFWQDDGHDEHNAQERSAWNHGRSLLVARKNYLKLGAVTKRLRKHVRAPTGIERRR